MPKLAEGLPNLDVLERARADAVRDAVLEHRREQEADYDGIGTGAADAQDLMVALGHFAERDGSYQNTAGETAIRRAAGDRANDAEVEQMVAANEIRNHYLIQDPNKDWHGLGDLDLDHDTLLDLSSAGARVRALDNLIQNNASDSEGEYTCAASSLLGAGILGGGERGTEGIAILLDSISQMNPESRARLEGSDETIGAFAKIREKMASGEQLNIGDMHLIQKELYTELEKREYLDAGNDQEQASAMTPGVQDTTIQKLLESSPELRAMMSRNEMGISYVRNDPRSQGSAHAVLSIGGGEAIYDPQLRDDGQIITDSDELANYQRIEARHVG